MPSTIRQGFTFQRADIQRAKSAAAAAGLSTNEWMRRALRAALDGSSATASPTGTAGVDLTTASAMADRLAGLLDRADAAQSQQASAAELLQKIGSGFNSLLGRYQAAAPKA